MPSRSMARTLKACLPLGRSKKTCLVSGEKGDFECFVPLERGINRIVVEASDAAGNTAYKSLRVIGKY